MDTVEVDGLRVAYQRAGEGPPLVLLHGAYEDSRVWDSELDDLSDEFTVVAWDTPGCDGSDDLPEGNASLSDIFGGFLKALRLVD